MERVGVRIHLWHIIMYLCVLCACVQSNRRGRIVRRFKGDSFKIPLHHQQNAVDIRTGQPYQSEGTTCVQNKCPARWMAYVQSLGTLNPTVTKPLCKFSHLFTPCYGVNSPCESVRNMEFTCCPATCMPEMTSCFETKPADFLCVPRSIQPWMKTLDNMNVWNNQRPS